MTKTQTIKAAGPKPLTQPKQPRRICRSGHYQKIGYKPGDYCASCDREERGAAMRDPAVAARYRAEQLAELGPLPDVLVIRTGDGKSVAVHAIPRGSRRRRR